jgi:hypothetical protein
LILREPLLDLSDEALVQFSAPFGLSSAFPGAAYARSVRLSKLTDEPDIFVGIARGAVAGDDLLFVDPAARISARRSINTRCSSGIRKHLSCRNHVARICRASAKIIVTQCHSVLQHVAT